MVTVVLPEASQLSLLTALGAAAAAAVAYSLVVSRSSRNASVKKPRRLKQSHWLLGDLPELLANATRFNDWVLEKTLECGEQPWLRHVPSLPDMVIVATPAIIEDITKTQHDAFGKGDFTHGLMYELIGDSFFSLDGLAWLHQRKIASKFFSARMYREVAIDVIHGHVANAVGALKKAQDNGSSVNLTAMFNAFALQTFAELGFGLKIEKPGDEDGFHALDKALGDAFEHIFRRVQQPAWIWKTQRLLNIGEERKYREITEFIRNFVAELVHKSLAKSSTKPETGGREAVTMVELFINAMQSGEKEITPQLLSDIAIMFVLGGRDTTADTLNWFFYSLSKLPEIEAKLRAELWDKVPSFMDGSVSTLTVDQAATLTFMEATIKETLRLYPVVTLNPRQALEDAVLVDGTFVPKGMSLGISAYAMARLKSVWGDDAFDFKPSRFIDETTNKLRSVPAFQFFSFGAGPRNCIGMQLAMLEMKLFIATVLGRFRLDFEPNDGSYKFSANLSLKEPLVAHVHAST